MSNARTTTSVVGVLLVIAGVLLAIYALIGYVPLNTAWWGYNFHILWGGIAALMGGIVAVLTAQTLLQEEKILEKRKRMEIQV